MAKSTTSTRKRTTTRKTTTSRKSTATAQPELAAASPRPAADDAPGPIERTPTSVKTLGKRELVDRVVAASGIKKKAAKPVVEAMLKELGDALSRDEALNLQPFGKVNIKKNKDMPNAEVIELRLRRSKLAVKAAEAGAAPTLAVVEGSADDPVTSAAE